MQDATALKSPIVLIVDDEALVRAYAADVFDELGFTVLEAGDGLEALDLLRTQADVTLLFSDCRMPRMDGPTLAAEAAQLRPELPVMLVTGHTDACTKTWPVLRKPYRMADLTRALKGVMPELDVAAA